MKIYEAQLRVFDKNGRLLGERFLTHEGKLWDIGNNESIIEAVRKITLPVPMTILTPGVDTLPPSCPSSIISAD
jgi:hypothetical protein